MKVLEGLNLDSKLGIDDLKFDQDVTEREILDRTSLTVGENALAEPRYGIVDSVNPRDLVESDINRPLIVTPSTTNDLAVVVGPGVAVAPTSAIMKVTQNLEIELDATDNNALNVVFLENIIVDSGPVRPTKFFVSQPTRQTQDKENMLQVVRLEDFEDTNLFNADRKSNIVVLAVVRVVETLSGTELQFDYTGNSYSFNRRWFSPVDLEHRSKKGSGEVTDRNPHGLSFNDLSSGELTFYEQSLNTGGILARDKDIKGLPGYACVETVEDTRIETDSTGELTKESKFGGSGARFIRLSSYPVRVTGLHKVDHKSDTLAFDWIEGTKIVVIPVTELWQGTAQVYYQRVNSLELPGNISSNTFTLNQPDETNELILSGGLSFTELVNSVVNAEGSGLTPRNYRVYMKEDGNLLTVPERLRSTVLLNDIGTTYQSLTVNSYGPSQVSVGLIDATPGPNLEVVVRLFGKNNEDITITEDIVFGPEWVSLTLPNKENKNTFIRSETVFSVLTGYQIVTRDNDGASSKIQIWAELESGVTPGFADLADVCSFRWNGYGIEEVRDTRRIQTAINKNGNRYEGVGEFAGSGGTKRTHIVSDDFMNPQYKDVVYGYQDSTPSTFFILVLNASGISDGDTITLSDTKVLTAKATTPNRSIGEFLIGADEEETRDDIILTINYAPFNSGSVAEADPDNDNRVLGTRNVLGSRGNAPLAVTTINPSVLSVPSTSSGGIDAFGETYIPHHKDFINSPLPLPSTYDVTNIRERYLSRAFPVDSKGRISVLLHGVKPQDPVDNVQVRARYAQGTLVWSPWVVLTEQDGIWFYLTPPTDITKIQIEIFGKVSGYSLFTEESSNTSISTNPALPDIDAVVGGAYATHATLAEAIIRIPRGKILVTENVNIDASAIEINKPDLIIEFKPGINVTKTGSSVVGFNVTQPRVSIIGGRFVNFSTPGDKAVVYTASANYGQVFGTRFNNCDTNISDLSGTLSQVGVITE